MRSSAIVALGSLSLVSLVSLAGCGGSNRHPSHGPVTPLAQVQAAPSIDAIADGQARTASMARGGVRVGDVIRGETLRRRQTQELAVELDADHCYWFGAATDEMGHRIALKIVDPSGFTVASERAKWSDAVVEYCPAVGGIYRVDTKLHHHGRYAVAVYAGSRLSPPVMVTSAVLRAGSSSSLEELIAREAAVSAPGARQAGVLFEGSRSETYWSTALKGGKCYWFIGAAQGGNVSRISLDVWDSHDQRIGGNTAASNAVTVAYCAQESGMFKFRAKIAGGSGPYKVAVYEKD